MNRREGLKTIMSRERLSTTPHCPACGQNFTLGEPVVLACGNWGNTPQLVHEKDAVFDEASSSYVERSCYNARKA